MSEYLSDREFDELGDPSEPEPFDFASFDPATATDDDLRAYARAGGSAMPLIDSGRFQVIGPGDPDRVTVGKYDDPGQVPMHVKSLRLPIAQYEAVISVGHPDGFSGVVREALTEWLARHAGADAVVTDVRQALIVLQRAADQLADQRAA